MAYQTSNYAYIARKAQSALGTQATGSGATILRTTGGAGGRLTKTAIENNEVRRDGMMSRGRHGSQKTTGAYTTVLSLGGNIDDIIEAVMRGTWDASDLVITEATGGLTSITTTTSTIVNGGGSWITEGLRVGDVIRLTGHASTGNNSRNLRLTGLTASTITVAETLTLNAVADTSFTITRPKKLINPPAGSAVKRYFTIEEAELDIDASEVFTDCVWSSVRFGMAPNGIVSADPSWTGTGQFTTVSGASAPFFTSPTETTALPLAVVDATVRVGTTDLVDLTAFDLTIDVNATAPDVAASKYAPDVFTGQMSVSMSITALRQDLQRVADFAAETQYSLHVLLVENEAEPKDFYSIHVPNFTLGGVDKSALARAGGARTQTLNIPAALCGIDSTGGAFGSTMIKFQRSL